MKNVNYIVTKDKEVVIVDEFTGRTMPGRRWGRAGAGRVGLRGLRGAGRLPRVCGIGRW